MNTVNSLKSISAKPIRGTTENVSVTPSERDAQWRLQLEKLRDRFTSVNLRSRTMRLHRCTRNGALDLSRLESLAPATFDELTQRLGREVDGDIALVGQRPGDPNVAKLAADVSHLAAHARNDWLETGLRDLAVGWPFLEGRSADGSWLRAPLFLYPAWLERTSSPENELGL